MHQIRLLLAFTLFLLFSYTSTQAGEIQKDRNDESAAVYLIKFKNGIPLDDGTSILSDNGFHLIKTFNQIDVFVASHNDQNQVTKFEQDQKDKIVYLEKDFPVNMVKTVNDKLYSEQSSIKRLDIENAWNRSIGSTNIIVAVSDTGIYAQHEDLGNQVWTNFKEIPRNGIDDDGNGFVDDLSGWNFIENNNRPVDQNGHGTHVAGILGAEGNNNFGVSGINWKIQIMPLKFLDKNGSGKTSGGIATILYAADNGARVLNASWGSTADSQALKDAINYAFSKGMLVIAAAGNNSANSDKEPIYPAGTKSDGVISVASSSNDGVLSSFSNFGATSVHLAAPGSNVLSTYINDSFKRLSGTSMATPMVTGVAGLILSVDPSLSGYELKNALLNSVEHRESYKNLLITQGDLNANKALAQLSDTFKIWPEQVNVLNGASFQFSAIKARGNVKWKLTSSTKNIANIDATGKLTTTKGKSGTILISAVDEQGNEAITKTITVINPNGDGGGGCTRQAFAGNGEQSSSSPLNVLSYLGIYFLYFILRKFKQRIS